MTSVGRRWASAMLSASRTSSVRRCVAIAQPTIAPAPGIEDDGEVEEARPGRDVGDVGDPELVGPGGGEVARHEIGRRPRIAIARAW